MNRALIIAITAVASVGGAPAASAQGQAAPHGPNAEAQVPPAYSELLRCRSVPEEKARLACFDAASARLEAATAARDIVVVDRAHVRQTKRTLFGLSLPSIDLFREGNGKGEEVDEVSGTIASARADRDGRWVVRLEDGAAWQQMDDRPFGLEPAPGMNVVIKRAALGSFKMNVAGQPAIRVRRLN